MDKKARREYEFIWINILVENINPKMTSRRCHFQIFPESVVWRLLLAFPVPRWQGFYLGWKRGCRLSVFRRIYSRWIPDDDNSTVRSNQNKWRQLLSVSPKFALLTHHIISQQFGHTPLLDDFSLFLWLLTFLTQGIKDTHKPTCAALKIIKRIILCLNSSK